MLQAQCSRAPIEVMDFQSGDLSRSQPQAGQTEKDGPIAPPLGCVYVGPSQEFSQLRLRQIAGQIVGCSAGNLRNRQVQGLLDPTLLLAKAQELPQRPGDLAQCG